MASAIRACGFSPASARPDGTAIPEARGGCYLATAPLQTESFLASTAAMCFADKRRLSGQALEGDAAKREDIGA